LSIWDRVLSWSMPRTVSHAGVKRHHPNGVNTAESPSRGEAG
jgi:hypothetical protein